MPPGPKHWLISLIALGWTVAGAAPPPQTLAAELIAAEAASRPYPELGLRYPELDDAALYRVQRKYLMAKHLQGQAIGGFKGGLFPAAPLGGVLPAEGLREAPLAVHAADFVALLVEAEIGFEFCQPVEARLPDVAALKARICRLRAAVELPDGAVGDLESLKGDLPRLRRALIPHNVASRRVALGQAVPADQIDVNGLPVETRFDGKVIGTRKVSGDSPDLWAGVLWVVNEFVLAQGYSVVPGQIVIPGNLTGIHPGRPGAYEVSYGALGTVRFTIR